MDKIKNYIILSLIILILLGLCTFLVYKCIEYKNKPLNTIISTKVEYKYDTLRHTDSLWFPDPVEVIKPIYDTIIDTQYVFNDYYTGKIYDYDYKDTNIKFHAGIMVHKNNLVYFIPDYEIYRKTTTITNNILTTEPPKYMVFVGGGIDYFNSVGLHVSGSFYFNKNDIGIFYDPFLKAGGITYKRSIIIK